MNQPPSASATFDNLNRRQFLQYASLCIGSSIVSACANSNSEKITPSGLNKVTFGTNWLAQAEHGGFYQAIATGIYKNHGLDVTIKMGGPQVPSGTQLLMGGAVDFFMGFGIDAINAVAQSIPKITVAAIFQKDPQCIITHPNTAIKTLADLKGKPIYVSAAANVTYWPLLKAKYGFTDAQKRPYNFNPAPFLADKTSAQQGYITSEPFAVEKQGGIKPIVFLLADYGYPTYATTIETKKELVDKNPDLVTRFVDASIKGWYSYLENPQPGNDLIKKANPEMTDEQLAYSLTKLKEYGIVISDTAEKLGIGAMSEARWKLLFDNMVQSGITQSNVKYQDAFTLRFVNKGVEYYRA
ncbi:putative secreted protein [Tolypothrix tenuis PCC 7101]|uniref:Putative secreted protein n=1 Tax=Tolypothrix tenuis PCC 7101 TaxID=231146 RepID=A0A1Z4MZ62_9CYAN|nr:ABC transporter substrate-binding protein [Aulosira sp. FACHB-113]BAY98631.1 putative secreted protein [Tolypothrix tenuis PCC 7101]BAZ77451.1 putative secreted protein [Aulosira laxa NIES-50]